VKTTVKNKLTALISLWALLILAFVGSKWTSHGGGHCSPTRLVWLGVQFCLVVLAVAAAASLLRQEQFARDQWASSTERGDEPVCADETPAGVRSSLPGDLIWTAHRTRVLPLLAAFVGCVAGLLGLGGGELMAPLLLVIGMLPTVASATSACMVLFTSSSNIAHYLAEGVLTPDPGYVCAAATLGFTSALAGRLLALRLVTRLSHPSLIAFILAGLLYVALALLAVQLARTPIDWTFAPLCGS